MPLTKIKSLGITDGTITGDDINSTFNLTGKTVTLPAGTGGKVLQVVQATDNTQRDTSSTSFVTGSNTLSVSITPSSSSNKVFILASCNIIGNPGDAYVRLHKNGTAIPSTVNFAATQSAAQTRAAIMYLDSPATTSSTTYQIYFRTNGSFAALNWDGQYSTITALEIAG